MSAVYSVDYPGGDDDDVIMAGDGRNLVLGDSGVITAASVDGEQFGDHYPGFDDIAITLGRIETITPTIGGADEITTGIGADIIFGGARGDYILAKDTEIYVRTDYPDADIERDGFDGDNIIFGDHGLIDWVLAEREGGVGADDDPSDIDLIISTDPMAPSEVTVDDLSDAADVILTGAGFDLIIGGAGADDIYAGAGNDLVFGDFGEMRAADTGDDHGDVNARALPLAADLLDDRFTFTAIFTNEIDVADTRYNWAIGTDYPGGNDRIFGEDGEDILLGQQGDDQIWGGNDDDDIIGGHNVAGGFDGDDRLDGGGYALYNYGAGDLLDDNFVTADQQLARVTSTDGLALTPIQKGTDNDVILGDNGSILRRGDALSPRFRLVDATGTLYDINWNGGGAEVLADATMQADPTGAAKREVVLYDHADNTDTRLWGNDYIAGGVDDDEIWGQLGDDVIQGDGHVIFDGHDVILGENHAFPGGDNHYVQASRSPGGELMVLVAAPAKYDGSVWRDGDDYIEGNGGNDLIFGGLGQDDIIGGSSTLFGLDGAESMRPDGEDLIFGGTGEDLARNSYGYGLRGLNQNNAYVDGAELGYGNYDHAWDSDTIAGDNANILRMVKPTDGSGSTSLDGTGAIGFVTYTYDWARFATSPTTATLPAGLNNLTYSQILLVVRSVELIDYTEGGPDWDATAAGADNGASDEIHGEAGNDFIYGMVGRDIEGATTGDVIFGGAGDDDIIAGWGNDWVSGGTGQDGILGDDGRIFTSRNGYTEPLIGLMEATVAETIATPGNIQVADIHGFHSLKKTVNLTPFNAFYAEFQDPLAIPLFADDVIFGGLGSDFLHGGSGDDLVSGAEALTDASVTRYDSDGNVIETVRSDYTLPFNPGDLLGYGDLRAGEFAAYDEIAPRLRIYVGTDPLQEWFGNFNADDSDQPSFGGDGRVTDGDDLIFGDLGNDWLIGGTGRDHMWGDYGNDLINADDDHEINGPNDTPDSDYSYEDIVFGGAGRDVMIGNTGGDRLIDWVGEFNSYIVPFAPFGAFAISRQLSPALQEYLYDLSEADGTDMTRSADTGNDAARNGEPDGEIGLVTQQDEDWQTQTGAPNDPQPGNVAGGKRDVLRGSDFNGTATTSGFAADSGSWEISGGRLEISPTEPGGDAASVYHLSEYLPTYFEVVATINAAKPTGGAKSNAYIIFDYISPTNFKFAGVNISTDKIELGRRTAEGWIVDKQTPVRVRPNQNYDILLVVNGTTATLVVDGQDVFTHVFAPFIDQYGVSHGLNAGMIGLGAVNSVARIDNLRVQILEREVTYAAHEDFEDAALLAFTGLDTAAIADSRIDVTGGQFFSAGLEVDENHVIRMEAHVELSGRAGFYFDAYEDGSYKFAILDANTNQLLIGHSDERRGFRVLYAVSADLSTTMLHDVQLTLKGTTVSVVLDGNTLKGFAFFAPVTDGDAGLLTIDDAAFAYVMSMTDDPMMLVDGAVEILGEAEDNFGTGPDPQGTGSKIWFYENSVGGAIPDRGTLISVISVSEGFDLADLDVTITVSHRKLSTLIVELIAPDGTVILLASNLGGDGFTATVFDDDAAAAIADGTGSFTGIFRPMGDLTRLEGMAATGDWTLRITDSQKRNTGDLQSWSLAFTEATPAAMVATLLGEAEAIQAPGPAGIDTTLQAAVDWWIANGDLSEEEIALLYSVEVELASLDGTLLATTDGNIVTLDADAAGHGWWIDPTPDDSDEFNADGRATDGNVGGMDLLSVLIHELGHVLGENHSTDGVMEESLAPATRTGLSEDVQTAEILTLSTSSAAGAVIFAGQNLAKSRYVDWRRVA